MRGDLKDTQLVANIAFVSCLIVGTAWLICLGFAVLAVWKEAFGGIEALGQFGDAFGPVNALFTGLALIGLLFTLVLQAFQAGAQREQTQAQWRQLALHRNDSSRQSREQYFAARLNAQVALMQIEDALNKPPPDPTMSQGPRQEQRMASLRKAKVKIELLAIESELGTETGAGSLPPKKEAIRLYLREPLRQLVACWDRGEYDEGLESTVAWNFDWLNEIIHDDNPVISSFVLNVLAELRKLPDHGPEVADWVRRNMPRVENRDDSIWK
jgi:hypothetical protein